MYLNSSISYDLYNNCSTFSLEAIHVNSYYNMDFDGQNVVCGGDEYYAQNVLYSEVSSGTGYVAVQGYVNIAGSGNLNISEDVEFTASGGSSSYTLYTSVSGSGSITWTPWDFLNGCSTSCSTPRPGGTYETFTATPASGYQFTGWGGACAGYGTGTCYVTMDSDKTVTASFAVPATVTAYATDTSNQTTSADSITVIYGTAVEIGWTTSGTSSCNCTASTGATCSNPSYGDKLTIHNGGTFYPATTTTYTVNCN